MVKDLEMRRALLHLRGVMFSSLKKHIQCCPFYIGGTLIVK